MYVTKPTPEGLVYFIDLHFFKGAGTDRVTNGSAVPDPDVEMRITLGLGDDFPLENNEQHVFR